MADVVLTAVSQEGKIEIPAHRVILSLASQFFWDQFVERNFENSQLRVPGIDPSALESIVK